MPALLRRREAIRDSIVRQTLRRRCPLRSAVLCPEQRWYQSHPRGLGVLGHTRRCVPGPARASSCVTESIQTIQAGVNPQTAVCLLPRDSLGNPSQPPLDKWKAVASGPGPMHCTVHNAGESRVIVLCDALSAGTYQVEVCLEGEACHGSPCAVHVLPCPVAPASCLAVLCGDVDVSRQLVAGSSVEIDVTLRDAWGNVLGPSEPDIISRLRVVVVAHGPNGDMVKFARADGAGAGGETCSAVAMSGTLTLAGSYRLSVTVGEVAVPGWPVCVHVAPGPPSANHSNLEGDSLSLLCPLLAGTASWLIVRTSDRFCNPCVSGGALVEATITRAAGGDASLAQSSDALLVPVAVTDLGDGGYSLAVVAPCAGLWHLRVCVCGAALVQEQESSVKLRAVWGELTADDCRVQLVPSAAALASSHNSEVVCGGETLVRVYASSYGVSRQLSGADPFTCVVEAPGGLRCRLPAHVLGPEGCYVEWVSAWNRPGRHAISVYLGGAVVPGTPLEVLALAKTPCLRCSTLDHPPPEVVAGQRIETSLHIRDVSGSELLDSVRNELPNTLQVSVEQACRRGDRIGKGIGSDQVHAAEGGIQVKGGELSLWFVVNIVGEYFVHVGRSDWSERISVRGRYRFSASSVCVVCLICCVCEAISIPPLSVPQVLTQRIAFA